MDGEATLDLRKECEYIVAKAQARQTSLVSIACLVFLANEEGDAFAFDVEDKFACQLCALGEKQRYPLFETATQWAFKWPWRYYLARRNIYFERMEGGDASDLPWMKAAGIERAVDRYNRQAGTNYHL